MDQRLTAAFRKRLTFLDTPWCVLDDSLFLQLTLLVHVYSILSAPCVVYITTLLPLITSPLNDLLLLLLHILHDREELRAGLLWINKRLFNAAQARWFFPEELVSVKFCVAYRRTVPRILSIELGIILGRWRYNGLTIGIQFVEFFSCWWCKAGVWLVYDRLQLLYRFLHPFDVQIVDATLLFGARWWFLGFTLIPYLRGLGEGPCVSFRLFLLKRFDRDVASILFNCFGICVFDLRQQLLVSVFRIRYVVRLDNVPYVFFYIQLVEPLPVLILQFATTVSPSFSSSCSFILSGFPDDSLVNLDNFVSTLLQKDVTD